MGSVTLSMFKSREADAHEDVKEINKVFGTKLEVLYSNSTFLHLAILLISPKTACVGVGAREGSPAVQDRHISPRHL